VLIVVSKASQRMHVFSDGEPWATSPVSTGRRGHETPAGVFPILQKQVFHRSNRYSNAPMPYMQRLTWSGIAIHAGRLPGYAASHGCIRIPYRFARSLYDLTRANATTVVVANERIWSEEHARQFALGLDAQRLPGTSAKVPEAGVRLINAAEVPVTPAVVPSGMPAIEAGPGETIQLAAVSTPAEADAHWTRLLSARPDLARFRRAIVPAVVGSRRVYRLRASAPDAHATCLQLKSAGIDCFKVL
jgi:hypothetical protein